MADELPIYYWDTCLFLEHLREERQVPTKKRAIQRILAENKDKQNRIMTSVLTHSEAIPKKITLIEAEKEALYWSYFDGQYFLDVEISRQIINLSREIKDYYFKEADPKLGLSYQMLGTGDAIHIATAIVYGATEFHTRDKRPSHGNVPILRLAAMALNGKIAGKWDLKIVDPEDEQADLLDQVTL